ncbi:MAG: SH3 domain-containing protein [Geminicoccaceae bacterium]
MRVMVGLMGLLASFAIEITMPGPVQAAEGDRLALSGTNVNVRSSPGLDGDVVTTINSGETIIELALEGDWYYVNLSDRNRRGWIYAPLLKTVPTTQPLAPRVQASPAPAVVSSLAGNPARGEAVFYKCGSCHTTVDGYHADGPSLHEVFGRRPAGARGFGYSRGMQAFAAEGNIWDEATLDRFIQRPAKVVRGTSMPFSGVRDPQDRKDLIAYIQQLR